MDQIKSNLKAVVGSSKYGIPLLHLENEYKRITNTCLNYRNYNFKSLQSFIASINDVVRLDSVGNTLTVFLVTTSSDSQCLKNLCNLIQHTKIKKIPKYNNNIPQNVVAKANYNNLTISVSNDHYGFNSNGQQQRNGSYNAKNRTWNSQSPSSVSPSASREDGKMPPIKEDTTGKDVPSANYVSAPTEASAMRLSPAMRERPVVTTNGDSHKSLMSNNKLYNSSGDSNGNDRSMCSTHDDVLMWPLHFDISINVLHKPAQILGIQSGHALVTIMDQCRDRKYVETTPYTNGYPGDSYLWQPPHIDPSRPQSSVDTTTVFPVILLLRINADIMKVRVSGLKVLLDVHIKDLHNFPKSKAIVVRLRSEYQSRQVTLVRLALIPDYFDSWNAQLFTDVYFAPICLSSDTDFVFERCQKRGDFMNLRMLTECVSHVLPRMIMTKRLQFLEVLKLHMEEGKKALLDAFNEMVANQNPTPSSAVTSVLSYIYDIESCTNKLLLGCPAIFSSSSRCVPSAKDVVLERVVYKPETKSFLLFENFIKVNVARNSPLSGLYALNETFVNSHIANVTKLRFQAALLLHLPSQASMMMAVSQS